MYLIVTYGEEGMRGVQIRGIRTALSFPKEEVLFINEGYSDRIRDEGYEVIDYTLRQFVPVEVVKKEILEKYKIHKVIFADLPTNLPVQTSILLAAFESKIPTIVLENLYTPRQLEERAYTSVLQIADRMIMNCLSSYNDVESVNPKIKVLPPLIPPPDETVVNEFKKKLALSEDEFVILLLTYNKFTQEAIEKLVADPALTSKVRFIITSPDHQEVSGTNPTYIPLLTYKDISSLISLSDLVIGKMGYLQFLEVLALGKPFVSAGTHTGYRNWWLDEKLQDLTYHFDDGESLTRFIKNYIDNKDDQKKVLDDIHALHNGDLYDTVKARTLIDETKHIGMPLTKSLVLFFEKGESDEEKKQFMQVMKEEQFPLPLVFSVDTFTSDLSLDVKRDNRILATDFYLTMQASSHSSHFLSQIYPWYYELNMLENLIKAADRVVVVGAKSRQYFGYFIDTQNPKFVLK
jgi:hypothetical protein